MHMNVVDLLITIVVVTILVTIVLAVITYVAYKLRLARQPAREVEEEEDLRFFVKYDEAAVTASTRSHAAEA
jgi:heme/copper-type cytochrome/quinol oxidase subunit 2